MDAAKLFTEMLTASPGPGPQLQERIYDHAVRTKDSALLARLAHFPGLTDNLDAKIGTSDTLDVLAAWATRPGRSTDQLTARLLKDKRVTVLLPIASAEGLDPAVYRIIAKIDSAKLAEALAENHSVPLDIRTAKIRQLVATPRSTGKWRYVSTVESVCANAGDDDAVNAMFDAVADAACTMGIANMLLGAGRHRPGDIDRWIDLVGSFHFAGGHGAIGEIKRLIDALAGLPLEPAQRARLLDHTRKLMTTATSTSWQRYYTRDLEALAERVANHDTGTEALFAQLAAATDAATADAAVAAIEATPSTDRAETMSRLVGIVARHPHVSAATGNRLWEHMNGQRERLWVQNLERRGDIDGLCELVELDASTGYRYTGGRYRSGSARVLHLLDDSTAVVDAIVARTQAAGGMLPGWFAGDNGIVRHPELAVTALPFMVLDDAIRTAPAVAGHVDTALARLGDNPANWDAFATLSADYQGTLDDLVDTVLQLG